MVGWGFADKGPDYERLTDAPAPGPASNASSASGPKRNRILLLLALGQIALLAFGCYGIVVLVELKLGRIVRSSRISPEVIRQAGWARRPLLPAQPGHVEPAETHPPQLILHEFPTEQSPATSTDNLHLLILTPLRNAERVLPTYFSVVSSLQHPKANTSFGFLIGDEDDNSSSLLYDWAGANAGHYRRISLLRKDFRMDIPSGDERHLAFKQDQRRSIMARARTFLVTATLEPTVDWVLWLDSDVADVPSTLFSDLLSYGNAGVLDTASSSPLNDIITPNIMTRPSPGRLHGYDDNNWAETPESIRMKGGLKEEDVLVEGNILHPTHRLHLSEHYTASNYSSDPNFLPGEAPAQRDRIDRFDPQSDAYIGRKMPLDAVGGVSTLVRATAHRLGAFFPPFPVDHQLETEGFGVLARKIGARIVGLPNYCVLHALQG